jgi:hypothetical protein
MTTRSATPCIVFIVTADMIHDVHQSVCSVSASETVMGAVVMAGCEVKSSFRDRGGGGDGDNGDGGDVTGGRKRRGRMKGGAATTTALSNVDDNVMGCHRRNKCVSGNSPA